VVLTTEYLKSDWANFEMLMMQTLNPINRGLRLIPVLKSECELPVSISMLNYVNFTNIDDEEFLWKRLLDAVKNAPQILVVDDEEFVRKTIGGRLEDEGYKVYLAADESDAIITLCKRHIDFLVVDVRLQGGFEYDESGLKLAQDFHKYDPKIRIIVLTGLGTKDLILRSFRDIKVDDFIEKDVDMDKRLLASIRKLS
jgi:CheY-like chemotaxis protein